MGRIWNDVMEVSIQSFFSKTGSFTKANDLSQLLYLLLIRCEQMKPGLSSQ